MFVLICGVCIDIQVYIQREIKQAEEALNGENKDEKFESHGTEVDRTVNTIAKN